MTIKETLLDRLRSAEESVYRISVQAGVSHSTLSRFLAGKRDLSLDAIDALAAYFNLTLVEAEPGKPKAKRGK